MAVIIKSEGCGAGENILTRPEVRDKPGSELKVHFNKGNGNNSIWIQLTMLGMSQMTTVR